MNAPIGPGRFSIPDYIAAIAPYVGGKPISEVAREYGLDENSIVKLASNENPLGMPPAAQKAIDAALKEVGRYPDGNGYELKQALSAKYDVPLDWLTLGNGSNDILELAARVFLAPGKSAVFSQFSFIVYPLATQAVGARSIVVRATPVLGHDLVAMRAAIEPDTQVVFLANPNNPTGTFLPAAQIENFIASISPRVIVVLDEAYNEYLPSHLRFDSIAWVRRYPNLIISRTFSKAYGLAGMRVGYGIAQPVVTDVLNRIRQPFNVNCLAQVAAIAALADTAFVERSATLNAAGYRQLTTAFDALGLPYIESFGNFVLVRVGDAARINLELLQRGVIVRPVANYGLPEWLRITIGLEHENRAFLDALGAAL